MIRTTFIFSLTIQILITFSFGLIPKNAFAQSTITGEFPHLARQNVRLVGFEGFEIYTIAQAVADEKGRFELSYTEKDHGMGYLEASDRQTFFVVLSGENIRMTGEHFAILETLEYEEGAENILFAKYASEHPRRNQALSAWDYLMKIYTLDTLFARATVAQAAIHRETERIKEEDSLFLANLSPDSYVSWFLPTRRLVSSVSYIAQYKTEEVPGAIAAFRNLDLTDHRLYKSGLFKDAIEAHYWLIENMGKPLDSVFIEMNISTDHLVEKLVTDEKKLNLVTNFLFDLMERRSLFTASEYLALKVLNETSCTIDADLAKQLETYRAMKKGNTAPEIRFAGDTYRRGVPFTASETLSGLQSKYYLIVFGATWCPKCKEEIPQIVRHYDKWRSKGVEVVYVSLDIDRESFTGFAGSFPFISTCDYKKWEGEIVQNYHVFATPLMFLLDQNREIILRPNTVQQMAAWVDWFLKD
jgi:thiol-disulfide isomerase/thioredoxin